MENQIRRRKPISNKNQRLTIDGLDTGTRTYVRATEEWKRISRLDEPASRGQARDKSRNLSLIDD